MARSLVTKAGNQVTLVQYVPRADWEDVAEELQTVSSPETPKSGTGLVSQTMWSMVDLNYGGAESHWHHLESAGEEILKGL